MLGLSYSLMSAGWMLVRGEQSLAGTAAKTKSQKIMDSLEDLWTITSTDKYLHLHSRHKNIPEPMPSERAKIK